MDVAPEAWVLLWGLTVGVVLAHARGPGGGWLLWAAAAVQAGAVVLLTLSGSLTGGGVLAGAALCLGLGTFLAGGHVWRDSPLLAGEGYWSRCVTAFLSERRLRRAHRETAGTAALRR
ncbi:hypothetical protein [uncultured Pseudokineococcus sp.]|uniref:hypothetical protein n=1 Tax=uncultured Pseudokineococcus sp. TaxID=1642928 RepID=UPI002603EAE4|nr:hypothetical protein [uncultured Pseudokineococcus sp.]